jgi:phenylalanyl-tRNA synthetase beta chain
MLIDLDWLKKYVDWEVSTEELAEVLSMGGLEVEANEQVELSGGDSVSVMELNVTPNRGYCLSYLGVAREVAALLGGEVRVPSPNEQLQNLCAGNSPAVNKISVENLATDLCPRYAAIVIENVRPGASPDWLQRHLKAVGLRPVNNIVDITNYVMLEYGQPLHAFDRELLSGGKIVIRRARKDEAFASLDGSELKLQEDALVIADAEKPVALAGIMGGANSQVSESTRNVVLESAYFDPVTVRKASKKYGIRTDSSYRFERGVDVEGVINAQSQAAIMIKELAGGDICLGRVDVYANPITKEVFDLRVSRVEQILGIQLGAERIGDILDRLGIAVLQKSTDKLTVEIPHSRPLLKREIDVIEEISRIDGYDKVTVVYPSASISPVVPTEKQKLAQTVKNVLCRLGYSESVNYAFIEEEAANDFVSVFGNPQQEPVPLDNPLSNEWSTMRTSLIPGLLKNAVRNISMGQKPVKIFEVGHIFFRHKETQVIEEKTLLSALVTGPHEKNVWKTQGGAYDFYDLKGVLETVLDHLKIQLPSRAGKSDNFLPGRSIEFYSGDELVGRLGEISPSTGKKWGLDEKAYVFEINIHSLTELVPGVARYQAIPKYPETYRDISILVDRTVSSQGITEAILEAGQPYIRRADLYDHFEGKKIEKGKKSLTLSLAFQSPEKTLTDGEVNPAFENIVKTLAERHGASLRE